MSRVRRARLGAAAVLSALVVALVGGTLIAARPVAASVAVRGGTTLAGRSVAASVGGHRARRATASGATAAGYPPCGSIVLPGYDWLGGDGVNVYSNGSGSGTGTSCGGISTVNGVVSGEEWQCVELIDRLYLTRGWIHATWFGNGADMYAEAPSYLAEQPQGSISFLSPGDVISYQSPGGVEPGHAGIVNTVTPISLGRFEVQLVQQNGNLFTWGILSDGTLTMTTGWVSDFPVIGVIHHPGATATAAEPADLLENASFENDVTAGWTFQNPTGGKVEARAAKASGLPEGGNVLELTTTSAGGSVYQDVQSSPEPGESFTFSIWARSDAALPERICAVLWGLGDTTEYGETCAVLGPSWTRVSAAYDVRTEGVGELRAQVFLHTPALVVELTGASLTDDGLASASFQNGVTSGWATLNPPGGSVAERATTGSGLPEGDSMLELSTTMPKGSIYQDVPVRLRERQSYTFSVWVRSGSGKPEGICVVLWGLGQGVQNGQTCTTIGTSWQVVSAPYDVSAPGLTDLRAQVYLFSPDLQLDLTGASLVDDGLANASFEGDRLGGWNLHVPAGGTVRSLATSASGLPEGSNLLEIRTSIPGGSVYQDVPMDLQTGQSFTFSVWARAKYSSPENICVVLWGVGQGSEYGETCAIVHNTWTLVSAPYDVRAAGLTELQAQVYLHTPGLALELTGASLGRG